MYFYKYQKPENLQFSMLRRGEVYFASFEELNDANECRPRLILKGTAELWERLARLILERVCFSSHFCALVEDDEIRALLDLSTPVGGLIKQQVGNRDFGIENLGAVFVGVLRGLLKPKMFASRSRYILESSRRFIDSQLSRLIDEPRYIASFSRNPTNPTMWGHYADAERGFVIVFGTEDGRIGVHSPISVFHSTRPLDEDGQRFEIGIYDEERLELQSVKYGRRPPKVNAFHRLLPKFSYTEAEDHYDVPLLLAEDAEEKEESQIGLVKYSDWRYEQEVRTFFPAFGTVAPDVRVLRVATSDIKGIIFGPRMSYDDKSRAVLCCHLIREASRRPHLSKDEHLEEFVFFQARHALDRFDFEILPIGILGGGFFGGQIPLISVQGLDKPTIEKMEAMTQRIAGRDGASP